ncbi:hypothetical protein E2320_014623 [Naja naja]|nr:hypothetical protein E2320_014623 [Naja naja]
MASAGESHAVVKTIETLSRGQDVGRETELLMKPYANWEEFLMPAPISIAILGELIFISTGQGDFSINMLPPEEGFQHLKYPESFKASLCQVSNQGWAAFNEAHVNMDQIRLLASSIPEQMNTIVRTLIQEMEVVTALLPNQLKNLQAVTEKCGGLAKAVRAKFTDVIHLIQELLEACLNAKRGYEKELKEVQIALEQAKIQEKSAKEAKEMAEWYHHQMKEQVEESFQQYKEAMDSIPEGWDAVGMELVTTLTQALGTFSVEFSQMLAGKLKILEEVAEVGGGEGLTRVIPFISASVICSKSAELLTFATSLRNLLDDHGGLKTSLILDEKSGEIKTEWVKKNFQRLRDSIAKEDECDPKAKAQEICQAALDICQQLEQIAVSVGSIGKVEKSLLDRIHQLHKKASEFDSYSKIYTRSPAFSPQPPNVSKMGDVRNPGVENTPLKVQQSREALRATREEYQRSFENFKKQNEELTEILCAMRGYQVKEADFDTARKMLIKGLEALSRVKEQWEKMVRFFQMISNLIETCLVWSVKEFDDTVDGAQKVSSYSSKAFMADLVYGHIFNASSVAQLVAMISETYTLVSEKYLMERVSNLGHLLAMEAEEPSLAAKRAALAEGCDTAWNAVKELVLQKKAEFERSLEARAEAIEKEMRAILPANREAAADPHLRTVSPEKESKFI